MTGGDLLNEEAEAEDEAEDEAEAEAEDKTRTRSVQMSWTRSAQMSSLVQRDFLQFVSLVLFGVTRFSTL